MPLLSFGNPLARPVVREGGIIEEGHQLPVAIGFRPGAIPRPFGRPPARRAGRRVPEPHPAEGALEKHGGIDQGDHAHRPAAFGAKQRADEPHFGDREGIAQDAAGQLLQPVAAFRGDDALRQK